MVSISNSIHTQPWQIELLGPSKTSRLYVPKIQKFTAKNIWGFNLNLVFKMSKSLLRIAWAFSFTKIQLLVQNFSMDCFELIQTFLFYFLAKDFQRQKASFYVLFGREFGHQATEFGRTVLEKINCFPIFSTARKLPEKS